MTISDVLALVKKGGVALLAAVALGWWTYHLDGVTRAERAEMETSFRAERQQDRKTWTDAINKIAESCLGKRALVIP